MEEDRIRRGRRLLLLPDYRTGQILHHRQSLIVLTLRQRQSMAGTIRWSVGVCNNKTGMEAVVPLQLAETSGTPAYGSACGANWRRLPVSVWRFRVCCIHRTSKRRASSQNFSSNKLELRNTEWGDETITNGAMHRTISVELEPVSWAGNRVEPERGPPDHLLVLVHGILASPSDWKYAEGELKERLGSKYLIYASSVNSYRNTLSGIDLAGKRLAEEIGFVVRRTPSLKRISFLGHSLGGLFARYAIAVLYSSSAEPMLNACKESLEEESDHEEDPEFSDKTGNPTIAGLDPVNFITLASPHLGVRGKRQLPFLFGLPVLEKLAAPLAPCFVGSTGRQLFLTDGRPRDPPLLLRMATDCDEGHFISALGSFKERTVYANVSYDHMVGWRTASIRRESELMKTSRRSLQGYKHVVNIVDCPPMETSRPRFEEGTAKAKEATQASPASPRKESKYHDMLEEEIIRGLQQVNWRKVDVSFHAALWPCLAHNHIHVKQEWLYHEGAGVVRHVTDTLKGQKSTHLKSNL